MSESYDVVIVGGGIIGAAVAYYLAEKKYGKIAVVEKDVYLGNGATAKCAGGIRTQFSSEINVRMSSLSEDKFETFAEELDCDVQFDQVGYLFLCSTEEDVAGFKQQLEMWQRLNLPAVWLTAAEIADRVPALKTDDLLGGTLNPRDGIGDPHQFTQGYVTAARRLGVKFLLEHEATGIETDGNTVTAVKTSKNDLLTDTVVNAAGPHCGQIAEFLGVNLPAKPYKRQIVTTAPLDFINDSFPMTVDVSSGLYTHKESGGLLLGWADKDMPSGFDESVDPNYTDTILMKGLDRIPKLETAEIKTSWGGLYTTTPDHHAIIGQADPYDRFFQAAGFSGHGFMHAPAVGIVVAELIAGQSPSIDISPLSLARFTGKELAEEGYVI